MLNTLNTHSLFDYIKLFPSIDLICLFYIEFQRQKLDLLGLLKLLLTPMTLTQGLQVFGHFPKPVDAETVEEPGPELVVRRLVQILLDHRLQISCDRL